MTSELKSPAFHGIVEALREKHERFASENPDAAVAAEIDETDAILERVKVPLRIRKTLSGNFSNTATIQMVLSWANDPNTWCLVLGGGVGVGKSTAAASWIIQWAQGRRDNPNYSRRWYTAPEFGALDSYGAADKITALGKLEYLVLDDLGDEIRSDAFQVRLDRLIDARYRDERRLIITTNLTRDVFCKRYGKRVCDRLFEGGRWFNAVGRSMRRGAA